MGDALDVAFPARALQGFAAAAAACRRPAAPAAFPLDRLQPARASLPSAPLALSTRDWQPASCKGGVDCLANKQPL